MKKVIFILSTDAPVPDVFSTQTAAGSLVPIRQDRLSNDEIETAAGLIGCVSVDQIDLMERQGSIARMLDAGGRMVINGHVLRPYVDGLWAFVPLAGPRRPDYALTRLADHPVFADIPAAQLETNRGVAGFYARGHNPPPAGALVLTGLGPQQAPVDWVWRRPQGGALFVHSGNDLWGVGDDLRLKRLIAERLVRWCLAAPSMEKAA